MPQYQISVPGKGTFRVDSPTELTDLQAWQAVQSQLAAGPEQPQKSTITGELVRGGKQLVSSTRTGLESVVSPEKAALAGVERGQKISEEAGEGPSFAAVRKAYEERGLLPAAGEVISQIPRALAGQGAQLAAMAGGARLGAMAGAPLGPAGVIGGGILGAGATLLPQFMGANVERQAQEQLERGEPVSIDRTKAYGAAAGQAALEGAGTAFVLGKRVVKGVLGIADDAALATAKAQQELAKAAARSVAASAGRGALRGTAEIPVEVAQAVLERAQAGLDLTSPEALSEYGENAYLAGLVGPTLGGAAGVAERSGARAKQAEIAPAPVAPTPEAPVATEVGLEQLTPQQKQELERQRAVAERPKTTEELLAGIQTGAPTTPEDVARIRDQHETAVIEGLLAQDAEMKLASDLAAQQRAQQQQQQRQQTQLESEAEAISGGISNVDRRVREGRIFARVQDLIDRNIPYASTAINDINQKFGVINEAPLTEEERARVENIMGMVNTFTNFVNLPVLAPKPVDQFAENQAMEALIKERTERGQAQPLRTTPVAPSPSVQEAPVSQGVGESPAVRPTGGVEPSVAQDRQLVTPAPVAPAAPPAPFTAPGGFVSSLTLSPAYEGIEPLSVEDADFELEALQNSAEKGRLAPEQFAGSEIGKRLDTAQIFFINEGLRVDPVGTITALRNRLKEATAAPAAPKAEAPALETPASETQAEPLGTRKEAQAFGKAIGATQPYPGELRGRVNLPAQKAAKEGNFQGVLSALEKSKNVIVAEIAKRARALGTKIVIDDDAEETYTGPSTLMRQMSIDGAKMHLEALNKIRELAPQVDALPDKSPLNWLGFTIRNEKIKAFDNGKEAGNVRLEDIAKMGHSMFAPLSTGPFEIKTKEDFKRLQKAYEDLTSEYGESALQLTSTGSAQITGIAGQYDYDTDTIRVPEYNSKREEVLAHEIVHAQVAKDIASPSLRQKPIVARLNKLYEHVKKELEGRPGRAPYGIQSIQEFVAEGMGNPAFQFLLKKIKYENTSAWDSFVQTIANLIGVKRDTAFTELLSIYSELTTEQKAETKAEPSAPAATAPAAPPTLDTTGIKEVKGRHIQVQAAAKLLQDKKMTREEFEKYVDYYKPIQEVEADKLLPPTTEQKMNETVNADKRDRINVPVEDGTKVGLRMDLPARERGGSVVSIHEGKSGKLTVGKLMGFRSTGWLKDVTFEVRSQEKGLAVATGAAKAPQQTVEGTWQNLGPEETYARVKELMKDPAWKQIGFDPSRHGYFYDRKTREPVVSASEMYQVGQFLLAKDVKYAPKTDFLYSLGGAKAQQSNFEQTLRTLLNKFGLKDVGLSIIEGMQDAGSYAQQLIRIADRADNPIRTLRHEAIHALRELGFFTDAQWKSLSKMAKDKWIDQYLKQRNEQGRPLKAGEESRYDAYMREYNGDMEKITEEAVADAFADFDATKPPSGMLQALLKRMKDLFQSIKSALTKIESPEQIFVKVEKGELKAGAKTEVGERKSLGKTTDPGQQALETIRTMGMDVPKPDPTKLEKAKDIWKKAKEDPKLTAQSALKAARNFMDKVETWSFSSDAKLNNDYRRAIISDIKQNEGVIGQLLEMSQSQAVHADALASQFMIEGGLKYNDELKKWESFDAKANFPELSKKLDEIGKKYNLSKEQIERVAHTYLVSKRLPGLIERNRQLDEEIAAEQATSKPDKKKIQDLEDKKVFISDKQLEQMEPGLSLGKTIPELNQVVNMWNEIRKNTIDVMVNSGLWSPEYAQAMWDNMDYVPYFREDQIENEKGPQEFIRGLQVKSKEFQLKGSEDAVHDVFDNMIRWTQYAINRSVRAHKALQMIDNSKDIKVGDRKMAEKVTEEKRGMNIARVFRDGKQELYDMADPMYVQAFSAIQNVSIPTIKFMAQVSNVLRQSVVLYPLFSVAQVPQDAFAAMFTSGLKTQHALKIPYLAVKEFIKTLNKTSATHNTLKKFGATGVRDFSATVIRDDAEIYAGLKPPRGGWGKTKEVLSHISMAADNAVRQAVYEASMQQGVKQSEAIEKAFDVINFRRKGTSKMLNILGQTVPFFYAYLSAQRVALKVLTGTGISPTDRKEAFQTLATTSAAVATLSLLYAMANGDDEDYMETPANIRDRTLTIPGSGGVRIPLRPDFFLFPKIIAEHTYLMLSDQGYQDGAKFRTSMKDALFSAVASPTPFPTAIKPAIEVAINYDFFQGKPLIGNFEKQKDLERQFRDSTSEFAKLLGATGMVSPIAADHMIRGMFGSFGGLFLYGTNQFLHSDPDVPRPELSAGEMLTALPGTSGLLKRPQESALKNDFYTLRDEVEKAVSTFNDIKTRSPQGMEDFLEDEKKMARYMLGKPVDQINRELSKIRRQMTIITNMPESMMSAAEKADFIRELREYEREYLKSVDVKALREMAKI